MNKEKVEINYYYIKKLLEDDNSTISVNIKNTHTIITFLSSKAVIISSYGEESRFGKCHNIVDAAQELLRIAEENENFDTHENFYKKIEGVWYIFDRSYNESLEL